MPIILNVNLAEQWPLLLVFGYIIVSVALWLFSEWFVRPSAGEDRAAKRERDWYESEFMRQRTIEFFQRARTRARAARVRRINTVLGWAGIPWRLRTPLPDEYDG